jgi:pyruvate dehydrogenase E2 component (dihydrolipoamide acetyltransferase)
VKLLEYKLPELGENIEAGQVVSVLVKPGDTISLEQPVLEVETDKAVIEVPADVEGVVKAINVKPGDKVSVGQVVLAIEIAEEEPLQKPASEHEEAPTEKEQPSDRLQDEKEEQPQPEAAEATDICLPELGENITSGQVVNVLVHPGDNIKPGQGLIEVETDKAVIEVPAEATGTVGEIFVQPGQTVKIGDVIMKLQVREAKPIAESQGREKASPPPPKAEEELPKEAGKSVLDTMPPPSPEEWILVPAAPSVRRFARELGVDIRMVKGTGPNGRIGVDDVKRFVRDEALNKPGAEDKALKRTMAEAPLPDFSRFGKVRQESMSGIRRATAEAMARAWHLIPHVTQHDKADITELEVFRKKYSPKVETHGAKLTITAILVKLLAAALKRFPKFNASLDTENEAVIYKEYCHIGVAVDTDNGLLVPVLRDADCKNITNIALELNDLAEKARARKLKPEDMQGASITLTNLGGIGGHAFTPIVNWPEVAILGVSRGAKEPVWNGESFVPKLMLPLSLSYDHRLIDGADAARFVRWIAEMLEDPFGLVMEG